MEIVRLDVSVDRNAEPISLGLNIANRAEQVHVNLFALDDNKGPSISDNLWKVARYVDEEILSQKLPTSWTLTSRDRTTAIQFGTVLFTPFKLDISDRHTLTSEKYHKGYSLEQYARNFAGQPPRDVSEGRELERIMESKPVAIFTVPCKHPSAKDGVFHCIPSYYDSDHMRNGFEFILADTKKVIGQLRHYDPEMLTHADRKFTGEKASEWLESTSMDYPRDMGHWGINPRVGGITMNSGQAGLIKLVQVLDLPFFPIAVSKSSDAEIRQIKTQIGYTPALFSQASLMKPVYNSSLGRPGF